MSTLAGTANFGIDSYVPEEYKQYAQMGIGSVNILAGIISTLQNFFRYAELMESHRSCGISWAKLQRDISVEVALDPLRRKHAYDFLKVCRAEYDRLMEQSPSIPADIIDMFKKQFKKDQDFKRPDICNGIEHCVIYEATKEDKVADIIATAGNKFFKSSRNIKLPNINNDVKSNINRQIEKPTVLKTYDKHQTLNELSELNNMKSVSAFLNKDKKKNINLEMTPLKQNDVILDIIENKNNDVNNDNVIKNKNNDIDIENNNDDINIENNINDDENNNDEINNDENNNDEINNDENNNDEINNDENNNDENNNDENNNDEINNVNNV